MDKFQFTQIFKDTTTGIIREARKKYLFFTIVATKQERHFLKITWYLVLHEA